MNKEVKYRREIKWNPDDEQILQVPAEYAKIIDGYLKRGLTILKITRRDQKQPDGTKKEHYEIEPVNEDGWI